MVRQAADSSNTKAQSRYCEALLCTQPAPAALLCADLCSSMGPLGAPPRAGRWALQAAWPGAAEWWPTLQPTQPSNWVSTAAEGRQAQHSADASPHPQPFSVPVCAHQLGLGGHLLELGAGLCGELGQMLQHLKLCGLQSLPGVGVFHVGHGDAQLACVPKVAILPEGLQQAPARATV